MKRENRGEENKTNVTQVLWTVADVKTVEEESKENREVEEVQGCMACTAHRHGSAGNAEGLSASHMPIAKDKLENCRLTKSSIPSSLTCKSIGTKACLSLSPQLF